MARALAVPLLVVASYITGTLPSAILVARSKGIDITAVGSGNPGASNVARTLGTRWGLVVFALDAAKGVAPAALGLALDGRQLAYACVTAAVVGHMFPVTRRFKGGKGVATMAGGLLVLQLVITLALMALWFAVRSVTQRASVASLVAAVAVPVGIAVRGAPGWEVGAVAAIAVLVLMRHIDNIKRLLAGREHAAGGSR